MNRWNPTPVVLAVLLMVPASAAAPPASIHYVYDDLNRLSAVVDQQGTVAVYTYDAVGNILRIERFDAASEPGAVAISYFTPGSGRVGTAVQVFGRGLGATPDANTLSFGGVEAAISAAAPNRLVASVPAGAATGPLGVTTPLGSAVSTASFVVLGTLAVTPALTDVQVGLTRQFHVTENGGPTGSVRWSVNEVPGGATSIGTISTGGLYTAPTVVPVPPTVTITAIHQQEASVRASAQALILDAGPRFAAASTVSLAFAAPTVVDRGVTAAVSVQVAPPPGATLATAPAVSLAHPPAAPHAHATSAPVALAIEPVILALSPDTGSPASVLTLTITGAGLVGTPAITFLRDNAVDPTITVGDVEPSEDGASLTAEITIGPAALPGGRVIQVRAAGAVSAAVPTRGNVFIVQ
jgi:YD repeat-containing protein